MKITVKVPDALAAQAKSRGMGLEEYVEEILGTQVAAQPPQNHSSRTRAEIRTWLDALSQYSDKIPPLPETISREWIYQDQD